MAKAPAELVAVTKMYDLVLWTCRHTAKFPRSYRFTLGDRMERRLYDLLDLLLRAKYARERVSLLKDANMELELLRFQFRLAKDLQCLSLDSWIGHVGHADTYRLRAQLFDETTFTRRA